MTFEEWYNKVRESIGPDEDGRYIDKDPYHPEHFYDYKAAYEAGEPIPKKGEHMTSKYKSPLHRERFVPGEAVGKPDIALWDSLEDREATMQEAVKANYDREKMLEEYGF